MLKANEPFLLKPNTGYYAFFRNGKLTPDLDVNKTDQSWKINVTCKMVIKCKILIRNVVPPFKPVVLTSKSIYWFLFILQRHYKCHWILFLSHRFGYNFLFLPEVKYVFFNDSKNNIVLGTNLYNYAWLCPVGKGSSLGRPNPGTFERGSVRNEVKVVP